LQPIRTIGEITTHIKILPAHQSYLYQKLSKKATQLRLLGMSCEQTLKGSNISENAGRDYKSKVRGKENNYLESLESFYLPPIPE